MSAIALALLLAASTSYVDPPTTGLAHEEQWVLEVAPAFHYVMRSIFKGAAEAGPAFGVDLRLARGLPHSGDELGLRLRPLLLEGEFGLLAATGYRLHAGRERWKSYLELEVAMPWIGGPHLGLRLAGGVLREFGSAFAWLIEGGVVGAVGQTLLGWLEVRAALQLRF